MAVGEVADAEPVEDVGDAPPLARSSSTASRRPVREDISTVSATVTGKFQLIVSTCGT